MKKTHYLLLVSLPLISLVLWTQAPKASAQRVPVSENPKICADLPRQFNLSGDLEVPINQGQPEVLVDWSLVNGKDPHLSTKVDIFMRFLGQNPTLGKSDDYVKNLFADHIYQTFSNSENVTTKNTFEKSLSQTLQQSRALSSRNVKDLFHDYYPYLLVDELKKNPAVSQGFTSGMQTSLEKNEVKISELLSNMAENMKAVEGRGAMNKVMSCLSNHLRGKNLQAFIPGSRDTVYGLQDGKMQNLVSQLKEKGEVKALLTSLINDSSLISESQSSLEMGINALLAKWSKNSNVQNLITFYETDPNIENLVDTFFASAIGKKADQCVRDAYGDELLPRIQEVYLALLKSELDKKNVCEVQTADVILTTIQHLLSPAQPPAIREEAMEAVMSFVNDYLSIESKVGREAGAQTPFNNLYKNTLAPLFDYPEQMTIELYRDGELIHTETNPNVTRFVDRNVPENTSSQTKYHQYYIASRTACGETVGESGRAAIDPVLAPGTPVHTQLDLSLKLRESQNQFFSERLKLLFKKLIEQDVKYPAGKPAEEKEAILSAACEEARGKLLKNKTSDELIDYVLSCFGSSEINDTLQRQAKDIMNPLIRFLDLNGFVDVDKITKEFLAPLIEQAKAEYELGKQLATQLSPLAKEAKSLLKVTNVDEFSPDQKKMIKCGGYVNCPQNIQALVESYLRGASHSADLLIEIRDSKNQMILEQETHTDIFGNIENLDLKLLKSGENYTMKIKLKDQPYVLPKISSILINSATPNAGGGYETTITLESTEPFFYGNFDHSDDVIDFKDIQAWSKLVEENPGKWSATNIDGFTGIDLFDVQLIQSNWGLTQEKEEVMPEQKMSEILKLFGHQGDGEEIIYTPEWLKKASLCQ